MSIDIIIKLFRSFGNENDIVHFVCDSDYSIIWTGKINEARKYMLFIKPIITGFSSRLFNPKTNMYEDGFYIYVRRTLSL